MISMCLINKIQLGFDQKAGEVKPACDTSLNDPSTHLISAGKSTEAAELPKLQSSNVRNTVLIRLSVSLMSFRRNWIWIKCKHHPELCQSSLKNPTVPTDRRPKSWWDDYSQNQGWAWCHLPEWWTLQPHDVIHLHPTQYTEPPGCQTCGLTSIWAEAWRPHGTWSWPSWLQHEQVLFIIRLTWLRSETLDQREDRDKRNNQPDLRNNIKLKTCEQSKPRLVHEWVWALRQQSRVMIGFSRSGFGSDPDHR